MTRLITTLTYLIAAYVFFNLLFVFFSNIIIFQPPKPATYKDSSQIIKIKNGQKSISAIYLNNPNASYTILLSHGNAEDLGMVFPLLELFVQHGYSVLSYDYQGYGTSEGTSSEYNTYSDIVATYDYLTTHLKKPPSKIILYGVSLGVGPTLYLASKENVAGIILQSPFLSAYRVKTAVPLFAFDKYNNIQRIKQIKSPLFVIHGKQDRVVPFFHGQQIYNAATVPKQSFWINNAGHNDIFMVDQKNLWEKIKNFTSSLNEKNT